MTYSRDTKLVLVRTLIQIEMADGDGKALPALREAEAIYDEDGHPHVGGGIPDDGEVTPRPTAHGASADTAAIQDHQTHRVIVGWTVNPDKSRSPVREGHPVGECANCRGPPR